MNQLPFVYSTTEEIINAAKRIMECTMVQREVLTSPDLVRSYLSLRLGREEHEIFCVLFLDSQNRLIEAEDMFRGTIDGASVYPREVIKAALKHNTAAVLVAHNHPSGAVDPSLADQLITERLSQALTLVDVRLIDHFIVSGMNSFSFAEHGLL